MSDRNLTDRLEHNVRREIRYVRGMQAMHRERYIEYCHDLRIARSRGDFVRARQIIEDLAAFTGEMHYLVHKGQATVARLVGLHSDAGFPNPLTAADDPPAIAQS